MIDILQGLASGGVPFLFAWVLPSAIMASAFSVVVFPAIDHLPVARVLAGMSGTSQALVMAFAAVTLGLILNAIDTPLYRLLEGYTWPRALQQRGVARQDHRKTRLQHRVADIEHGWRRDLYAERLERYPESDLAPTSLGNALRAFENYALDRYNLNSQLLWAHLYSAITDDLRAEYERSRAAVDFFVAMFYMSGLFASLALVASLGTGRYELLIGTGTALALMPPLYSLAAQSTSYWGRTTRAMVDLGRRDLANRLGLRLPDTTADERRMWEVVSAFVYYSYEEPGGEALDEFRATESPGQR
jgi:hypothetical protein